MYRIQKRKITFDYLQVNAARNNETAKKNTILLITNTLISSEEKR